MKALKTLLFAGALVALSAPAFAQDMTNEDWLDKGFAIGVGASPGIGATYGLNCSDNSGSASPGIDFGGANCGGTAPIGLGVRVFPFEEFGVELAFSMGMRSATAEQSATFVNNQPVAGDPERVGRVRSLSIAIIPEYRFLTSNRAALSAYAGIGITNTKVRVDFQNPVAAQQGFPPSYIDVSDSVTSIGFEFGLRGEVFLYKYFSIFGRVGIGIDPASDAEQEGFVDLQTPATTPEEARDRAIRAQNREANDLGGAKVSFFEDASVLGSFGFTVWFN